jgi:hypothetical protein
MALERSRERVVECFRRPMVHREKLFARHACSRYCSFRLSDLTTGTFKIPWLQIILISWLETFYSGSRRLACERRSTGTVVQFFYYLLPHRPLPVSVCVSAVLGLTRPPILSATF